MDNIIRFVADDMDYDLRIDKYLSDNEIVKAGNETISRSYIQKLIKDNRVLVNDKSIKSSYVIKEGDVISLSIPAPKELDILPENIELDILYEDKDIIVVNKPKGMVVHPSYGHTSGTLVNALMYHCKDSLSGINGILRPGIVHRIDMNTTGVLVCCKNDNAHVSIANQLSVHSIKRIYKAIVYNKFKENEGTVDKPIYRSPKDRKKMAVVPNGKRAVTHYKVIDNLKGNYAFIQCILETGRTHQIRVHMSYINHPLYGDDVYGNKKVNDCIGQALHAETLGFIHPGTNEYIEFKAPIPEYFEKLLNKL